MSEKGAELRTKELENQVQELQKQVAALQGCCQQLSANDNGLFCCLLAVMYCLLEANSNNAGVLGSMNGFTQAIQPVKPPHQERGFVVQRSAGSLGY
jgi:hypothetical protein